MKTLTLKGTCGTCGAEKTAEATGKRVYKNNEWVEEDPPYFVLSTCPKCWNPMGLAKVA